MTTESNNSPNAEGETREHLTWPGLLKLVAGCREPGEPLATLLLRMIDVCPQCAENCGAFRELIAAGDLAREDFDLPRLAMAYSRLRCRPIWERVRQAKPSTFAEALTKVPPRWAMVDYLVRRSVAALDMDNAEAFAALAFEVALKLPVYAEPDQPIPPECDEVPLPIECKAEALAIAAAARGCTLRALGRHLEAHECFGHLEEPTEQEVSPLGLMAPALVLRGLSYLWEMQPVHAAEWFDSARAFHRMNPTVSPQRAIWIGIYRLRALVCVDPLELAANPDGDLRSPTLAARELLADHPAEALPDPLAIPMLQACAEALLLLPPLGLEDLLPVLEALAQRSDSETDKAHLGGLQARYILMTGNADQAVKACDLATALWWDLEKPYRLLDAYVDLVAAKAQAGLIEQIPPLLTEARIIAADARLQLDSLALLTRLADEPALLPTRASQMRRHLHIHQMLQEPLPMFEIDP